MNDKSGNGDKAQHDEQPLSEPPQQLVGFMNNEEWEELIGYVDGLVVEMEKLPFPDVRDKVFELLAGIDSLHREALYRLVRLFKEGVLEQVITDPAIRTLMELYDLVPETQTANATSTAPRTYFPNIPVKVEYDSPRASAAEVPHWVPATARLTDITAGSVIETVAGEKPVLLCRVNQDLFALETKCCQDGAPLRNATISKFTLSCPNHPGCLYDVRQGTRIAASGQIDCYPVKTDDDKILVGFGMGFTPNLPTF
jgi:nitrite reductase/ring-hydroxylating ferredoxin subunit